MTYSKDEQLGRSPGGNRFCPTTGALRTECLDRCCIGWRANKSGHKKQARDGKQLAKSLGVRPGRLTNEETTRWPIRWEEKSGKLAEPVHKFYNLCEAQADAATPIGSKYPFCAVAGGEHYGLAVIKLDDLKNLLNEARRGYEL